MSSGDLDAVVHFLEACFHQDWSDEASCWEDVVDEVAVEGSRERQALARSVRAQASEAGAEEIRRVMRNRVLNLPVDDGQKLEDWLAMVADRLEAADRRGHTGA